ncbi:MAG: 50S ribosomal protein L15 [Candidatus Omnitrophota bacterium]
MKLNELKFISGSRRRCRIVGRGKASGSGKTSGRGHKGQNARSGGGTRPGFEGGQMPLQRRMPKRGFNTKRELDYQLVNLKSLTRFKEASVITPEVLFEKRLIRDKQGLIKILGDGELTKPLTIHCHAFSQSAAEKIKKAGGAIEEIRQ